jgi:hypothetical protein
MRLRATLKAKKEAKAMEALKRKRRRMIAKKRPVDPEKLRQIQGEKSRNARIRRLMKEVRAEKIRAARFEDRKWAIMLRAEEREELEQLKLERKEQREAMRTKRREEKLARVAAKEAIAKRKLKQAVKEQERLEEKRQRAAIRAKVKAREQRLQRLLKEIKRQRRR